MRTAKAFVASIALAGLIMGSTAAALPLLGATLGFTGWPDSPLLALIEPDGELEGAPAGALPSEDATAAVLVSTPAPTLAPAPPASAGSGPVSYTHLTLPTTPYV